MDNANSAARFDWIAWLATIPGVPSGWGEGAPMPHLLAEVAEDDAPDLPLAA